MYETTTETTRSTQQELWKELERSLRQHLSRISVETMLTRACTRCGLPRRSIHLKDLPRLIEVIRPALTLYLDPQSQRQVLTRLRTLAAGDISTDAARDRATEIVHVHRARDIDAARKAAMQLSRDVGLSQVDSVKVATVVSELARNISQYVGRGTVQLEVMTRPRGVRIIAEDQGSGIQDLDAVLSGEKKSKTGLGLGIRGSQRLMDRFEIESTPDKGTRITVEKHC